MERTLYLNDSKGIYVRLDGPSLWIKEKFRAWRRVPLRLIGEVVIKGNIRMETGVITRLVGSGIPVTFLDTKNDLIATTLELDTTQTILRYRVERLRSSKNGNDRIREWLYARRKMFQIALIKRFCPHLRAIIDRKGIKEDIYKEYVGQLLSRVPDEEMIEVVRCVIKGMFHELVLKKTLTLELNPHQGFLHPHENFGFVKDICHALVPEIERQIIQFFNSPNSLHYLEKDGNRWVINREGMKNIAIRFENHKDRLKSLLDTLFEDFFSILREFRR